MGQRYTQRSMAIDHGEAKSRVTCQVLPAEVHLMNGARPNRVLSPLTLGTTPRRQQVVPSNHDSVTYCNGISYIQLTTYVQPVI